jgi:N-acetyl-S-(2-succino)cysteine monooxygenase
MPHKNTPKMHLNAFLLGAGHHLAAWRHEKGQADGGFNLRHATQLAQTAERGLFDAIFFADILGLPPAIKPEIREQTLNYIGFEPITLLSYLAAVTKHIGLIGTASTTYLEPFHLARKFASLDLLSEGRAGWNLVTSATDYESNNFGLEKQKNHALRYDIAREYVDVVKALWNSFDDDAFLLDKANARFVDHARVHELNHRGQYYAVRGPLHVPRSAQGNPVLVQAGSSDDGQDLAAYSAEVVFTAQQTLPEAQAFYKGLKSKLASYHRQPGELLILPGVCPILGRSLGEAQDKHALLQNLIPEAAGISMLGWLGIDFSKYDLDGPFPDLPVVEGAQSRQKLLTDMARRDNLTIRQVYQKAASGRGHFTMVGTPAMVADLLEEWFTGAAADGFNIMSPILPEGLNDFVDQVVPELQRRGLFRTEYEGTTLRANLGLKR